MKTKDVVIGIIGSGGDGVIAMGEIIVNASASLGIWALQLKSYGAQIRGGESSCKIRISNEPVQSQGDKVEILVVYNWKDFPKFKAEFILSDDVIILYPENNKISLEDIPIDKKFKKHIHQLPMEKLSIDAVGEKWAKNIVTLGILANLMEIPSEVFETSIAKKFGKKGKDVVEKNKKAFQIGYDYVCKSELSSEKEITKFQLKPGGEKLVLTGNDAFSLGAIYAGAEFFAGYPITPSSEIMEFMSRELVAKGGVFVQTEDEISAIAMCIGASFAGKRAFTATSGPGVSLMMEGIGLACISELPVVIVNVQRGGPSTGVPTKTEQGDLGQAIFGCHGDAPKVVIAPCDIRDCFNTAIMAFYIAEKYQIPVLVLSDQYLGNRISAMDRDHFIVEEDLGHFKADERRITPEPDELEEYVRYKLTKNGVSPTTWPGMEKGMYLASGIAHDEHGTPTAQVHVHQEQNVKRYEKFIHIKEELNFVRHYGDEEAEVAIICWGSTKGVVKEAVTLYNSKHKKQVKAIVPQIMYPSPVDKMTEFLETVKTLIVVEMSYSSQFLKYLRTFVDLPKNIIHHKRSGGAPFTVGEIYEQIEGAVNNG